MRTATLNVRSLIDRIDRGEIRLPEIQRAYVWKPKAIADLIESLYREYPSGSLLLWEADGEVAERGVSILKSQATPMVKPLYLLDGQQRLTSLHRAYSGHERARVVFNVVSEKFQVESAATKKDEQWVRVTTVVNGEEDTFDIVDRLAEKVGVPRKDLHDRLERLRRINNYDYYLEILEDLPYTEITEIFIRVNSRGRRLRTTDLALATLSARWPGTVQRVDDQIAVCAEAQYPDLGATFLTRCLAAFVSSSASPKDFATADIEDLEVGWAKVTAGVDHLIKVLKGTLLLDTSALIPSVNALIPIVAYLGEKDGKSLDEDTRDALLYWLLCSWVQVRFSAAVQTALSQDVAAVKSEDPIGGLFRNLGLLGHRVEISDAMLAGRGSTSPLFLLSYLSVRSRSATDWWHAVPVSAAHDGDYSVEYHHIHPRATLKATYAKSEINDLANLAFISAKANRKISSRSPAAYFPELSETDLDRHLIPSDPTLRTPNAYPSFVSARRALLADEMTALLERFRPGFLDEDDAIADPLSAHTLTFDLFGEASDGVLHYEVVTPTGAWAGSLPLTTLEQALTDVADGRGSEIEVDGQVVDIPIAADELTLPCGSLDVTGSLDDWRTVLDRELGDARRLEEAPATHPPAEVSGDRLRFSVLDSD